MMEAKEYQPAYIIVGNVMYVPERTCTKDRQDCCSECGCEIWHWWKHCQNCGAKVVE